MATRVKNWEQFQHFKDRSPPWIKLYRTVLDDPQWHKLDDGSAKILVMLWLLASENHGNLPNVETIAFRLRKDEKEVIRALSNLSHWMEGVDINVISERYQEASTESQKNSATEVSVYQERETEVEKEREEERETEPRKSRPSRKCPESFSITEDLNSWATEHGIGNLSSETDKFRDHTFKNPITDWKGAWRNWMRRAWESRPQSRVNGHFNKQEALEASNRAVAQRVIEKIWSQE